MSKKNTNINAFVDAARMRGMLKHYALGGATTLYAPPGQGVSAPDQSPLPLSHLIGNNEFSANLAPTQEMDYSSLIGNASGNALSGYSQMQGNIGQQQALLQQLMAQGRGEGPNPAQAALNQNTGKNISAQAALMAGQRGSGANAGMIARQVAQQGAQTQQQAVGQEATLAAQQQLAAQQGALAATGQIGNQITNEQAANQALFGTAAGAANTQNANRISNYGMAQGINSQISQNNANNTGQTMGGIFQGASSMMSMMPMMAEGGQVTEEDKAKNISDSFNNATAMGAQPAPKPTPAPKGYAEGGPVSWVGQFLNSSPSQMGEFGNPSGSSVGTAAPLSIPTLASPDKTAIMSGKQKQKNPNDQVEPMGEGEAEAPATGAEAGMSIGAASPEDLAAMNKGGKAKKVPAMLSPGEQYLPPSKAKAVAEGKAHPMSGKKVPGKAKVKGDSLKNDTVPAALEDGGVVVKRSVMNTGDPEKVKKFVQAVMAHSGPRKK